MIERRSYEPVTRTENEAYQEMYAVIEQMEANKDLYLDRNFCLRTEEIDFLEVHIIGRIDALLQTTDQQENLNALKHRAQKLSTQLEAATTRMFDRLHLQLSRSGDKAKFLNWQINALRDFPITDIKNDPLTYDHLDLFLNGLLSNRDLPAETKSREPEMVFYQKTPARIILELIKKARFQPDDVFFDLGAGLGQVVMLVNILAGILSKGVEFEPAFCHYAFDCAADLHLSTVEFINIDARHADYTTGTVFFMYTPFRGKMLRKVLKQLKREAQKRKLKIFTYGPCTKDVAQEDWLIRCRKMYNDNSELGEFHSIELLAGDYN